MPKRNHSYSDLAALEDEPPVAHVDGTAIALVGERAGARFCLPSSPEEVRALLRANGAATLAVIERRPLRPPVRFEPSLPAASMLSVTNLGGAASDPAVLQSPTQGFPDTNARSWFYGSEPVSSPAQPVHDEEDFIASLLRKVEPPEPRVTPVPRQSQTGSQTAMQLRRPGARRSINDSFPDTPWG